MKCIVCKDMNLEGHCITGYLIRLSGKNPFQPFTKSAAIVFDSNESAYEAGEKTGVPFKVLPYEDPGYHMEMVI